MKTIVSMIKARRSLVVGLSIILTTFLFIFNPFSKSTITIAPSPKLFDLEFSKDFNELKLTFKEEIYISQYLMSLTSEDMIRHRSVRNKKVNQQVTTLKINNLIADSRLSNEYAEAKGLRIRVQFESSSPLEIISVIVDNKMIDIETFYATYLFSSSKKLNKYKYIRSSISNFLLKYNDLLSNIILTVLTISLIPLLYELIRKSYRCYFARDMESYLKSKYNLSNDEEIDNAAVSYGEIHERSESMYRFLQLMGPAIGFVLTISSLIAGLHPSLQEVENIKIFFETIQVAMVSTFLGLLIRIMAIFLQRVDNKILLQVDEALFNIKENFDGHNNA